MLPHKMLPRLVIALGAGTGQRQILEAQRIEVRLSFLRRRLRDRRTHVPRSTRAFRQTAPPSRATGHIPRRDGVARPASDGRASRPPAFRPAHSTARGPEARSGSGSGPTITPRIRRASASVSPAAAGAPSAHTGTPADLAQQSAPEPRRRRAPPGRRARRRRSSNIRARQSRDTGHSLPRRDRRSGHGGAVSAGSVTRNLKGEAPA